MRLLILALVVLASLPALEELDKELARQATELAKLDADHQQATAKLSAKTITNLERLAAKQSRAGDLTGASLVWKEILRQNTDHADARKYFTALGVLDTVLADVTTVTDVLGNPIAGSPTSSPRTSLLFSNSASLVTNGSSATGTGFSTSTVEMLVSMVTGDGTLFSEGGDVNAQIISLSGNQLTYIARAGTVDTRISTPFDRSKPWNHIAVIFDNGKLILCLNGKAMATATAPYSIIPDHSSRCILGAQLTGLAIAGFRMTREVRYQSAFTPPADLRIDDATVLGFDAALLKKITVSATANAGKPNGITALPGAPDPALTWVVNGNVSVQ